MLLHATSEQLVIPSVPLHLRLKKKQLPAIFSPVPSPRASLAPSLFLLHTCSFSPPRNAESRCCTGTAAPRRERSFLPTRLHAVRTKNTLPRTRPCILISLSTRTLGSNQRVRYLLATCHHERRWRTPELKRKQQCLQILA